MKRSASRATRLTVHPSPFHSSVTLFEAEDGSGLSTPRRSKRVKLNEITSSAIPDMEDTISEQQRTPSQGSIKQKLQANSSSPRQPKPIPQSLKTPHPAPPRWREAYDAIKEMRSHIIAPVDTMGCDQAQLKETDLKVCTNFCQSITLVLT
jgi:endonuclease-3